MCFSRVAQRQAAADGQNEFAIAHVVGKRAHLGWIRLGIHARNLHCGVFGRSAFQQPGSVAKRSAPALPCAIEFDFNNTANGVGNGVYQGEADDRLIVVNGQHAGDAEGASGLEFSSRERRQ